MTTIHSSTVTPTRILQNLLPITKSDYQQYLACPPEYWLLKHQPELFDGAPDVEMLHILRQGNEIESLARDYFKAKDDIRIEFQCIYKSARLYARADIVLTEIHTGIKTLIEVKSGTSVKAEYLDDLAFQVIAAESVGVRMNRIAVLHVNKEYIRSNEIDIDAFFTFKDISTDVIARIPQTRINIEAAIMYLEQNEPVMQLHEHCGQKLDCPAFKRNHPNLPDYSVFNISRIGQPKLRELLMNGIVDILDVPRQFELSEKQRLQVDIAQAGIPYICHQCIKEALDGLQYPLYFLDYETLQYGIPLYDDIAPYQQMVFQWSLHILYEDSLEPEHLDFLSDGSGHPAFEFVKAMHDAIPNDGGSVLVWNKSFEMTRNKELAQMFPKYESFFMDINERVFDLMEIFQKQHFVHPAFRGSYSIKQVMPVLVPQLTYADLEINHGMLASIRWFELVTGQIPELEKEHLLRNLREYCKLDTLAMLEIYRFLRNLKLG